MAEHRQYIYTLTCPISMRVIYIGQTCNISGRLYGHCFSKNKTKISNRIQEIKAVGKMPLFDVLDIVSISEAHYWEMHYIQLMKTWGFELLNTQKKHKKAIL